MAPKFIVISIILKKKIISSINWNSMISISNGTCFWLMLALVDCIT